MTIDEKGSDFLWEKSISLTLLPQKYSVVNHTFTLEI